jgi:hypothetical protein
MFMLTKVSDSTAMRPIAMSQMHKMTTPKLRLVIVFALYKPSKTIVFKSYVQLAPLICSHLALSDGAPDYRR